MEERKAPAVGNPIYQRWHSNWLDIQAKAIDRKRQQRLNQISLPTPTKPLSRVTDTDCHRLEELARRIKYKCRARRGWQNHYDIFPHRKNPLHKN